MHKEDAYIEALIEQYEVEIDEILSEEEACIFARFIRDEHAEQLAYAVFYEPDTPDATDMRRYLIDSFADWQSCRFR